MSDILTKSTLPGTAAVPGNPGTPASPAYTYSYVVDYPIYGTVNGTLLGQLPQWQGPGSFIPGTLYSFVGAPAVIIGYSYETIYVNVPAQPGTPGWTGQAAQPVNFQLGWNSSAVSIGSIAGGNALQFTIPVGVVGAVVGLAPSDVGTAYAAMPFSFYFTNGQFTVLENGLGVNVASTSFLSTDVFSIVYGTGTIQYYKNSTLVYTSTQSPTAQLFANAVMYSGGDAVDNAAFVANSALTYTGTGSIAGVLFGPCNSSGLFDGIVSGNAVCAGQLNLNQTYCNPAGSITWPIAGFSGNLWGCKGILTPVTSYWTYGNGGTAFCSGLLTTLTGDLEGQLLQPNYAFIEAGLTPLSVFSYGSPVVAGNCQGVLFGGGTAGAGLYGFATNEPGGWCAGQLLYGGALGGGVYGLISGFGSAPIISYFDGWGSSNPSQFDLNDTGYPLEAFGDFGNSSGIPLGFYGTIGALNGQSEPYGQTYTVSGQFGCQAQLAYGGDWSTSPSDMIVTTMMEANLVYPAGNETWSQFFLASGTNQNIMRAYLNYGTPVSAGQNYQVTAQMGAQANLVYGGDWSTAGSDMIVGQLGEFYGTIHQFDYTAGFTAHMYQTNFGSINGVLTGLSAPNKLWGFYGSAPKLTLVATMSLPVSYASEAYSCTLIGKPDQAGDETVDEVRVTHYTQYPFNQIVRFGSTYYGVNSAGVFALTGDTFNGANIVSVVKTAESDLGEPTLKRHRYLWIGGRLGADFTISFTAAELYTDPYTYVAQGGGAAKWRVKLGRGLQSVYGSYTFTNTDGVYWEINELGPEVDVLKRSA